MVGIVKGIQNILRVIKYLFLLWSVFCSLSYIYIYILDDVVKRENSIEQINQEGFVFKVFKPSDKKKEIIDKTIFDVPKLNEEIVNSLSVEESAFLISNRERLLSARVLIFLLKYVYIKLFVLFSF